MNTGDFISANVNLSTTSQGFIGRELYAKVVWSEEYQRIAFQEREREDTLLFQEDLTNIKVLDGWEKDLAETWYNN